MSPSLAVLLLASIVAVGQATEMSFENLMPETISVGIQSNPEKPMVENGGFDMEGNSQRTVQVPDDWAGRFWARTGCNAGSNCQTGDCGGPQCEGRGGQPPVTLVEITLKGDQNQDFYDVSLVDGYNVKASIEPTVPSQGGFRCAPARCATDINEICPEELSQDVDGRTVACKSACLAFDTDEYCCRNAHDQPETCKSSDWPVDYPRKFKDACPDAYSYAYDDNKSTFTCENAGYKITFG